MSDTSSVFDILQAFGEVPRAHPSVASRASGKNGESASTAISVDPSPSPAATKPVPTDASDSTLPGDDAHLDHPENWTTGDEPATAKQKGYLKVLEKQTGSSAGDVGGMGKSEASEKIDEMRQ